MDDYLPKPYSRDQLRQVLRRHLAASSTGPEPAPAPNVTIKVEPPVLDRRTLEAIRGLQPAGGADLLLRLVGVYLEHAPPLLEDLRAAVRGGDARTVERAAHKLKSSSASLGASGLVELLAETEELGRAGEIAKAADRLGAIEASYEQVRSALRAEIG